jgi:putative addiction module killer protein
LATAPPRVRIYATTNGRTPFTEWLEALKDRRGRALIRTRLRRISLGNFGDCKSVGGGISELRVDFGPGYRIYFARERDEVIVFWGGEKRQQDQDILRAKIYWSDYRSRGNA